MLPYTRGNQLLVSFEERSSSSRFRRTWKPIPSYNAVCENMDFIWCARCILVRMVTRAFQMKEEVELFFSGTWRAEEHGKRPGIVGRMEKLGRRRNPEVIRVPSHHMAVPKVQQGHQTNPKPHQGRAGCIPSGTFPLFIPQNPKWHFFSRKNIPEIFLQN